MGKDINQPLLAAIRFQIPDGLYLKDPESSVLGKRILGGSIDLIDEIGFDSFTFKKLGNCIDSPEASVYRYFENKHQLLLYLTYWYWSWIEYQLDISTAHLNSAEEKMRVAIRLLTTEVPAPASFNHMNEAKLNRIVINESSKTYLSKQVDADNKEGAFRGYKRLVQKVSDLVMALSPGYKYPHMLISTVIEGAHHQRFFAEHLPSLTDHVQGEDTVHQFYSNMIFKSITQ